MITLVKPIIKMWLLSVLVITTSKSMGQERRITPGQNAPLFSINDVSGNTINLADFKGKKVLLTFFRNVGCPVCNLRFHELQELSEDFKSKEWVQIAVYESTPENMKKYLEGENFYAIMIPNPTLNLYQMFQVERSTGKFMKGMFHGVMGKMSKGKKFFRTKIKQDGNTNRIGADFIIDENGKIQVAYYGKYIGDHIPITDIKKLLK